MIFRNNWERLRNLKTPHIPIDLKTQTEKAKQHAADKQKDYCQPKTILETTNLGYTSAKEC